MGTGEFVLGVDGAENGVVVVAVGGWVGWALGPGAKTHLLC